MSDATDSGGVPPPHEPRARNPDGPSAEVAPEPRPSGEPAAVRELRADPEPREPTLGDVELARRRPTYVFFGVVAALSLFADIGSKAWAEVVLSRRTAMDPAITLVKHHLSLTLAYNKGGAWRRCAGRSS
jgi:hypothetical protein